MKHVRPRLPNNRNVLLPSVLGVTDIPVLNERVRCVDVHNFSYDSNEVPVYEEVDKIITDVRSMYADCLNYEAYTNKSDCAVILYCDSRPEKLQQETETTDGSIERPFHNLDTAIIEAVCLISSSCDMFNIVIKLSGVIDYDIDVGVLPVYWSNIRDHYIVIEGIDDEKVVIPEFECEANVAAHLIFKNVELTSGSSFAMFDCVYTATTNSSHYCHIVENCELKSKEGEYRALFIYHACLNSTIAGMAVNGVVKNHYDDNDVLLYSDMSICRNCNFKDGFGASNIIIVSCSISENMEMVYHFSGCYVFDSTIISKECHATCICDCTLRIHYDVGDDTYYSPNSIDCIVDCKLTLSDAYIKFVIIENCTIDIIGNISIVFDTLQGRFIRNSTIDAKLSFMNDNCTLSVSLAENVHAVTYMSAKANEYQCACGRADYMINSTFESFITPSTEHPYCDCSMAPPYMATDSSVRVTLTAPVVSLSVYVWQRTDIQKYNNFIFTTETSLAFRCNDGNCSYDAFLDGLPLGCGCHAVHNIKMPDKPSSYDTYHIEVTNFSVGTYSVNGGKRCGSVGSISDIYRQSNEDIGGSYDYTFVMDGNKYTETITNEEGTKTETGNCV